MGWQSLNERILIFLHIPTANGAFDQAEVALVTGPFLIFRCCSADNRVVSAVLSEAPALDSVGEWVSSEKLLAAVIPLLNLGLETELDGCEPRPVVWVL